MNDIPIRISVVLLFLFLCVFNTSGQTVVEGYLKNRVTLNPICDAVCTITQKENSEPVGFALSDSKGYFRIAVYLYTDSVYLNIAHLSYGAQAFRIENRSCSKDFELEDNVLELQEVAVKGSPIWSKGDTLNYNVDTFRSQQDRVIGDILKKLPGIEVSKEGTITYQGEAINRFYVEGMDLLQNKYSIATNNISADAVERVQVLENHQPISALKNVTMSDRAAINLKLKEDKKGALAFTTELGLGASKDEPLWLGKVTAMQFGHKRQTIGVFRTNNTGHNLSDELTDHSLSSSNLPMYPADLVSPLSLSTPPIDESRYLDNHSYSLSVNNLWKIGENKTLRLMATWLKEKREQELEEWSNYYLGDADSLFVDEFQHSRQSENRGEVIFSYTNNAPSLYLDNTLKFYGKWASVSTDVTGTSDVWQHFEIPLFVIQNSLELVKTKNRKTYQFYSFCRYSAQPQELKVNPDAVVLESAGLLMQHSEREMFRTLNRAVGSRTVGNSVFSMELGLNANLEHLSSDLGNSQIGESLGYNDVNHLKWNRFEAAIAPRYFFGGTKTKIEVVAPIIVTGLYANKQIKNEKQQDIATLVNPVVSLRYTFNPRFEIRLSGGYQQEIGDMMNFADGLRMMNYRTFTYGSGILEKRKSQTYSMRFLFRNQVESLFANLSVVYRPQSSNIIRKSNFIGDNLISSGEKGKDRRKNIMLNAYAGKYFGEIKTNVTVNVGYTGINYKQYQQSLILPLKSHILNSNLKIDIAPVRWSNIVVEASYFGNKMVSDMSKTGMLSQIRVQGGWFIFPSDDWQIKVKGEYLNNELTAGKRMNLFFMDFGVKYLTQRWEFSVDGTNILDKRAYEYSSYDGVNTQGLYYRLRPSEVLFTVGFRI